MNVSCPSCGAPVAFRGTLSLSAVCGNCRAQVARTDAHVTDLGKVASVPYDMSPIEIGSSGRVDAGVVKGAFEVVGRIKRGWSDGFWNEWVILFGGTEWAWLAEAQGFWAILSQVETKSALPQYSNFNAGKKYALDKFIATKNTSTFTVTDIKEATILAIEGELPTSARPGDTSVCIDLTAPGGHCVTLEYPSTDQVAQASAFIGRFFEPDDLHLTKLRALDGWRS